MDQSLLIDRQLDTADSALSSSSSTQSLLEAIFWTSVSLRGRTVTLTVSSEHKNEEKSLFNSGVGLMNDAIVHQMADSHGLLISDHRNTVIQKVSPPESTIKRRVPSELLLFVGRG